MLSISVIFLRRQGTLKLASLIVDAGDLQDVDDEVPEAVLLVLGQPAQGGRQLLIIRQL